MQKNCVRNDNDTVTITAVFEGEEWQQAQRKALNKLKNSVNLKGFRKGQVPAGLLKRTLGTRTILAEAASLVGDNAFKQLLDEYNIDLIDRADFDLGELTEDKAELIFICPVEPKVTLGEYKNLGIAKDDTTVSDEEVEAVLNNKAAEEADFELVSEPAADNDKLNVMIRVKNEGEEDFSDPMFQEVTLGKKQLADALEEGLKGAAAGEVRTIESDEDGKKTTFQIEVQDVYRPSYPEINDEFVSFFPEAEAENLEDLKNKIRESLVLSKEEKAEDKYLAELIKAASENASVNIPDVLIDKEADNMVRVQEAQFRQMGIPFKDMLAANKMTLDDVKQSMWDEARNRVMNSMVLRAIAQAEGAEVTAEDLDAEYAELAKNWNITEQQVRAAIAEADLRKDLMVEKGSEILENLQ